jgi:hypothetical protein
MTDPPRAHINNLAAPVPEPPYRLRRLAEIWSALSVAALIIGVMVLFILNQGMFTAHLLILLMGFLFIDAALRLQLSTLVTRLAVILAIVTAFVLVYEWSRLILLSGLVVAVVYLAWTNVREVFR